MNKLQSQKISDAVGILVNQPLNSITRAATMICFHFGELVETPNYTINNKTNLNMPEKIDRYALHIQTAFRLRYGEKIILGMSDVFQPKTSDASNADFDWESFDYDIPGNNLFDESLKDISNKHTVKKCIVSSTGDLTVSFDNGLILEVFIDTSIPVESWRFFDFTITGEDIVVTNSGLLI